MGTVYTIGPADITASVVGPAVGSLLAAQGQVTSIDSVVQQFGGTLPAVADVHFGIGANPCSNLTHLGQCDPNAHLALFQKGTDGSGNATLTQVGPSVTVPYGAPYIMPGVALDPALGDLVLFTAQVNDPVTFGLTQPGAAAPAPSTPGGSVPLPPPGPVDTVAKSIADAMKKYTDEAAKHADTITETALLAGAAIFVIVVALLMLELNPRLPAQVGGAVVDEWDRHRDSPPTQRGAS